MVIYRSPKSIEFVPDGNAVKHFYESKYLNPSNTCLIDPSTGHSLTVEQARQATLKLATVLAKNFHIQSGSVVLLTTTNSIYLQLIHHAILALGGIVSPANVQYTVDELAHQIKAVNPSLIIATYLSRAKEASASAKGSTRRIIEFNELKGIISGCLNDSTIALSEIVSLDGRTHPAYYCQSSGTSGLPKTVALSHTNIAVNMLQWAQQGGELDVPYATVGCCLPMSHILALQCYVWVNPYVGSKTIIFERFNLETLLRNVEKYQISSIAAVPPVILALTRAPNLNSYNLSSLKGLASAAAPLSESLVNELKHRLNVSVSQFYGQTESSPLTIGAMDTADPSSPRAKQYNVGSIGWIVAGTEARIVDLEGNDTDRGELWVRGPQVMLGYLNNPEATASTLMDGCWLRTGDVARVDSTGQFYIVDRIKELIKSKGHQVAPAELEGLLLEHPSVQDCAVVGVYDEAAASEGARAYVVLAPGADVSELLREFNGRVAPHKRLFGGIVVVETVPKSPSGKILRRLLRDAKPDKVHYDAGLKSKL